MTNQIDIKVDLDKLCFEYLLDVQESCKAVCELIKKNNNSTSTLTHEHTYFLFHILSEEAIQKNSHSASFFIDLEKLIDSKCRQRIETFMGYFAKNYSFLDMSGVIEQFLDSLFAEDGTTALHLSDLRYYDSVGNQVNLHMGNMSKSHHLVVDHVFELVLRWIKQSKTAETDTAFLKKMHNVCQEAHQFALNNYLSYGVLWMQPIWRVGVSISCKVLLDCMMDASIAVMEALVQSGNEHLVSEIFHGPFFEHEYSMATVCFSLYLSARYSERDPKSGDFGKWADVRHLRPLLSEKTAFFLIKNDFNRLRSYLDDALSSNPTMGYYSRADQHVMQLIEAKGDPTSILAVLTDFFKRRCKVLEELRYGYKAQKMDPLDVELVLVHLFEGLKGFELFDYERFNVTKSKFGEFLFSEISTMFIKAGHSPDNLCNIMNEQGYLEPGGHHSLSLAEKNKHKHYAYPTGINYSVETLRVIYKNIAKAKKQGLVSFDSFVNPFGTGFLGQWTDIKYRGIALFDQYAKCISVFQFTSEKVDDKIEKQIVDYNTSKGDDKFCTGFVQIASIVLLSIAASLRLGLVPVALILSIPRDILHHLLLVPELPSVENTTKKVGIFVPTSGKRLSLIELLFHGAGTDADQCKISVPFFCLMSNMLKSMKEIDLLALLKESSEKEQLGTEYCSLASDLYTEAVTTLSKNTASSSALGQ
jgi:hypothetical protein